VLIPTSPAWADAVEQRRIALYTAFASQRGMTIDAYRDTMVTKIEQFVLGREVRVRVRLENLESILRDGRLKNQFETNTSGGALNPAGRRQMEERMFAISPAAPPSERPTYGYLEDSNEAAMIQYGNVIIRLGGEVAERTTFTLGDTLDHTFFANVPTLAPVPLTEPTDAAAHTDFDLLDAASLADMSGFGAAECQIHAGVSTTDFVGITFSRGGQPPPVVEELLEDADIQWMSREGEGV
jgi:Protein of unknown function (DUF3626)